MYRYYWVDANLTLATVTPLSDYSGSTLRFGLMDIKPVQVIETVKRFGMKFKRTSQKFELLKPPQSYEELVTQRNETIFGTIEMPEWFDASKLVETFSQDSISRYEKDEELKEMVESIKKADRKGRPLLSFIQFMKQRFESRKDHYVEIEANRFLRSNFPLSFYTKFVVSDKTYYDILKVLEGIVRMYEYQASTARSFSMYKKKINEMKRKVAPILDNLDEHSFSCSCLKKFVMVWNSKDYEEVTNPEFLDIDKVERTEFHRLSRIYNSKLREVRGFLLHYDPDFLCKEIYPIDNTAKMFGKLVMFPSSSLSFKG